MSGGGGGGAPTGIVKDDDDTLAKVLRPFLRAERATLTRLCKVGKVARAMHR